jgi:RHS repeat-associated protein
MQMEFGSPEAFDSTWNYQYDLLGQLSNAWKTANGSTVPGRQYGYEFDDIGNRMKTTRGNNTSDLVLQDAPVVTSTYTLNLLNQYEQRTVPAYAEISGLATNAAILSFQNESTGDHIRSGRNDEWFHATMPLTDNSITGITNDVRMTAVLPGQGTAGADLINTNQTLTLSAMQTPEVFEYDNDGNLTSDGRFTYTWNGENRLICASNESVVAVYQYDYQGRRVQKQLYELITDNWELITETKFLWNGNHIIHEESSSKTNTYCWGLGDHLVSATLGGTNVLYAHDGNKNVTDLINDSGNIIAHYEFDPFGNIIVTTGSLLDSNLFRFSNEYFDLETDLVTYKYRPYNPMFGGWLSRDPIGEIGGDHLYAFVHNSPVNGIDLLGLSWWNPSSWFGGDEGNACTRAGGSGATDACCCGSVTFDPVGKCCENGQVVDKVTVMVINRSGGQRTGTTDGHIDLVVPGFGLIGFFGDQSNPNDGSGRGIGWNIPGNLNVGQEWLGGTTPRPGYTLPPGMTITLGQDVNGNPVRTGNVLSTICELKVCPAAAAAMSGEAGNINADPSRFRIAGRNCSSMGCQILGAGGVMSSGISGIDNPQNLIDQLQTSGATCYTGYVYWNWHQDASGTWTPNPSDIKIRRLGGAPSGGGGSSQ